MLEQLASLGAGAYIIGLDNHTGFIIHRPEGSSFIHSAPGAGVVSEPVGEAAMIVESNYKVIGKLFCPQMQRHWIEGSFIPVRHNYFAR